MTKSDAFPAMFLALAVAGCAGSYRVVEMPQYQADLYPLTQTKSGVTIAIDEIKSAERAERYFGADLVKEGIVPVNVVVSNYGKERIVVKPSDILLHRGKDILDPMPVRLVAATAKRQHGYLASKTEEEVDKFLEGSAFKERLLMPSETYRGILFFNAPPPKKFTERFFTTYSTYGDTGSRLRVGLTNLDSGDRVMFGPFWLAMP